MAPKCTCGRKIYPAEFEYQYFDDETFELVIERYGGCLICDNTYKWKEVYHCDPIQLYKNIKKIS